MDINDTIKAFRCCVQIPPVCAECPQQGPVFGIVCKQNVKDSVSYWLNVANEAVESENESRYGNAATHEKRKQVMVELSDCLEILRDIDSLDLTKNERANLHGSILSAVEDAIALLKVRETPIEKTALDYGLTPDGIEFALQQYQKVICEITHSRMSKLSYYADDILRVANEVWCDYCEIKEAQEPRVMTSDEIDTLKNGEIVWYEQHGIDGDFISPMVANGRGFIGNADMGVNMCYLDNNERVWTSRPSDAQREATAWEPQQR